MVIVGCKPNLITYTVLIKYLCEDGKIEEAFFILANMEKERCYPDLVTYNIILRELSHQDRAFEISELMSLMDQRGLSPDPFTLTALAAGMLKKGKLGKASNFLLDVITRGYNVDIAVYNMYLHSLCLESGYREALSMTDSMTGEGFTPNTTSYNIILKGMCSEGNVDDAFRFLDRLKLTTDGPDIVSFNTILSGACKQGNYSIVQKLLDWMEDKKVELNVNHLLGTACRVLRQFRNTGTFPDISTYDILVHTALGAKEFELAEELITDMHSRRLEPDAVFYRSLISGMCKDGNIRVALQPHVASPTSLGFQSSIQGLCRMSGIQGFRAAYSIQDVFSNGIVRMSRVAGFEELHEKLINKELALQVETPQADLPATAFISTTKYQNRPNCNAWPCFAMSYIHPTIPTPIPPSNPNHAIIIPPPKEPCSIAKGYQPLSQAHATTMLPSPPNRSWSLTSSSSSSQAQGELKMELPLRLPFLPAPPFPLFRIIQTKC
ncbi:hypothetical protein RDABS01_020204 [Bienertia sinuspersici]